MTIIRAQGDEGRMKKNKERGKRREKEKKRKRRTRPRASVVSLSASLQDEKDRLASVITQEHFK